MPLAAPSAAMLLKVRPFDPMVVLATFRAVPVVVSMVLAFVPVCTVTVPPPVALKPAPLAVSSASAPVATFFAGFGVRGVGVSETAVGAPSVVKLETLRTVPSG
jgi:hypothetical protein